MLALAELHGMRSLAAHCHFGLGRLYDRMGRREPARESLNLATKMYRDMNMDFWLKQDVSAINSA